jgi:hypothetical protein
MDTRACGCACECALPAATVLERCIRSPGRVHAGAALSGERRMLRCKLRTFCSEVRFSLFAERSGIPALCTPGLESWRAIRVRQVHAVCLSDRVACCMCIPSHFGVWPVHNVHSVTIRASAQAGMTAVKGHGKCRRAPRRMTGVVLLDTWHVADVYRTYMPNTGNFHDHDLRTEWTAEVLRE